MPDKRAHRGQHPKDAQLFSAEAAPVLQDAVRDLSWLLTRGYSAKAALKLVGDRYSLRERQRVAVGRGACSDDAGRQRESKRLEPAAIAGHPLWIDAYNQLITAEAGLSGGVLLRGRDGAWRDVASVHSTYRRVEETVPALELLGERIAKLQPSAATWLLDRPVSNSGRLRQLMLEVAAEHDWQWEVRLVWAPDKQVVAEAGTVVSSDSWVLDRCASWLNVTAYLLDDFADALKVRLA